MARLAAETSVPIAAGESLAGRRGYQPLLEANALDVAIVDLGWTGGITEARKIASLADSYGVAVAAHDCSGPISLAVALHFATSIPNARVQEITRAFYHGWYRDLVTELPPLIDGRLQPLQTPGHGLELHPKLIERDIRRRTTRREETIGAARDIRPRVPSRPDPARAHD